MRDVEVNYFSDWERLRGIIYNNRSLETIFLRHGRAVFLFYVQQRPLINFCYVLGYRLRLNV